MRELKFRAFYPTDKQMIDWNTLHQSAWNTFRGDTPLSLIYEILVTRRNEFEVMQFTGLKDKNGKEVYDGDILKSLHFIEANKKKHYLYHKVGWCERLTGWQAVSAKQDGTEPNGNPQLWVYFKNTEFVVYGNIHENPELLSA